MQHRNHRIGAQQHLWLFMLQAPHHNDGSRPVRRPFYRNSKLHQQLTDTRHLRRRKTHAITAVVPQKPAHRPVAQSAVSIEHHQQPVVELWPLAHTARDDNQTRGDSGV